MGERQNGSCSVDTGRSKEVKVVRSGLRLVSCLLLGVMVISGSELLPGFMSGPMALLQLWSVLLTMSPDTTKGREDRPTQSRRCPSLAATLERAGSAPHPVQYSREQVLSPHLGSPIELTPSERTWASWPWRSENGRVGSALLVCHVVVWVRERCPLSLSPNPLTQTGEPTQPLPSCSTLENGPCTLRGQCSGVDTVNGDTGERPGGTEHERPGPALHQPYGKNTSPFHSPSPSPPLATYCRWESRFWDHKSGRTVSVPHQL